MARKGQAHRYDPAMHEEPTPFALPVCALCSRPVLPQHADQHHLLPKSRGGRDTVLLHRICHRQIHALFTETELARHFPSIAALLEQEQIQQFVRWIQTKPSHFSERTRKSNRLRR